VLRPRLKITKAAFDPQLHRVMWIFFSLIAEFLPLYGSVTQRACEHDAVVFEQLDDAMADAMLVMTLERESLNE
jgi:hypothetical protein